MISVFEFLIIFAFIGGIVLTLLGVFDSISKRYKNKQLQKEKAYNLVAKALASNNYGEIDNVLILCHDQLDKHIKAALEERRNDLYITDKIND